MRNILVLAMSIVFLAPLTQPVNGTSLGINESFGVQFGDPGTDTNEDYPLFGKSGLANKTDIELKPGVTHEYNNTVGNITQKGDPDFDPSDPVQEYKINSSDMNIDLGTDPNLNDAPGVNRSFITDLPSSQ